MRNLNEIENTAFDVVVIGGGIIGAGIARDATMRGLKVALFEQKDFGSGTTSGSSRLIHGGLRYLEQLDFRLVRLDLRERETLFQIAPHLVKPLEFLIPFYDRSLLYRARMKLGMMLYDLLSYDKSLPGHSFLSAREVQSRESSLNPDGLSGGALYYDAQAELPERLCLENILDARTLGACTLNYAQVVAPLRKADRLEGVRVRDLLSKREFEVRSRLVVNAAGPWFDQVSGSLEDQSRSRIRTTKGIHIAMPPLSRRALVLFSPIDGRLFFVIPWLGFSWVGTTDTDFKGDPSDAMADRDDVRYLLHSLRKFLSAADSERIYFSNAGIRALVMQPGSESSVSRMHRVQNERESGVAGLISVLGGKITGYRAIAEEVTDLICRKLKISQACQTARVPLPGARGRPVEPQPGGNYQEGLIQHLNSLYGTRSSQVLSLADSNPELASPLCDAYPDIAAQVVFAVRFEQCVCLSDFLLRRTGLGYSADQGVQAVERVASLMAETLSWPKSRKLAEIDTYLKEVAKTQSFQREGENIVEVRPQS